MSLNFKLGLKVLKEIQQDLQRVEAQLVRFKDPVIQQKYREQVKVLQQSADRLFEHYKIILESQV